jgi:hypothetical protein
MRKERERKSQNHARQLVNVRSSLDNRVPRPMSHLKNNAKRQVSETERKQ